MTPEIKLKLFDYRKALDIQRNLYLDNMYLTNGNCIQTWTVKQSYISQVEEGWASKLTRYTCKEALN